MCSHKMIDITIARVVRMCKVCQDVDGILPSNVVVVQFADDEMAKLKRLARNKQISPSNCLRRFVQSCQPDGGGWVHPMKG